MAKIISVSPLAPASFPAIAAVPGVRLGASYAGLRYAPGRDDLLVALVPEGATVAGVFTRSLTASAAVKLGREAIRDGKGAARLLIVAAGNSIAGTGAAGEAACRRILEAAALTLGCAPHAVQFGATGVIGEPFPVDRLLAALPSAIADARAGNWEKAARAISTTDTFPKAAERVATIDGAPVRLAGFIKGSGMIQPNMATMLGYVFTNARLPADVLADCLRAATQTSFNCITVDSDTSTSDSVLLFATGVDAGHGNVADSGDPRLAPFRAALGSLCLELAQLVVRDGEGARKFIAIRVSGAASDDDARVLGLAIGNSPLVKTAIAGGDANWGRIVMAVGKAGVPVDPDNLTVSFGGVAICRQSQRVAGYDEAPVAAHLAGSDIDIAVDVGVGPGSAVVYTCDLTAGYIAINADYRS